MVTSINNRHIELVCYLSMIVLTGVISFTDKVPLHVNLAVFSLATIIIGSYRSLYEMVSEIKKVHLTDKKNEESNIQALSAKDAMQFPLVAGATLLGLYIMIKVLGKESVNYFILVYLAVGGTTGIKALLQSFTWGKLEGLDENKIIDIKNRFFELQLSILDIICFVISCI